MNFGIQSVVADLLAKAGAMLYTIRYNTELGKNLAFDLLLPIHDAFLIEVDEDKVEKTVALVSRVMSVMNKIPGTDLNLGVDVEVMDRWGEKEKD
jgi:DNA polymerase I-like protein with 3'-5' exonuclease and polymerase domains